MPGQWVIVGDQRIRIRDLRDLQEDGEAHSANWTRPELLISTVEAGRIRRLRSLLPTDEGADVLVGRSGKKNDIVLSDEHVSRRHMRIVVRGGRHIIEDLGSRWGTFVNDRRIGEPAALVHGDEIRIGRSIMRFVKFSDGMELSATDSQSGSPERAGERPSWVQAPPMDDAMTITATTLLASPVELAPEPPPAQQPVVDPEGVSVSDKLKGWMRRKK
ncbi:MAG: hypothetical protein Kow0022_02880 [Phycisphaerales bacterium]